VNTHTSYKARTSVLVAEAFATRLSM